MLASNKCVRSAGGGLGAKDFMVTCAKFTSSVTYPGSGGSTCLPSEVNPTAAMVFHR